MYATGCAAVAAEGFVLAGSAAESAILRALFAVNGSWSNPSPWDKARFACLYRVIHVSFRLYYIVFASQSNQLALFNLTVVNTNNNNNNKLEQGLACKSLINTLWLYDLIKPSK